MAHAAHIVVDAATLAAHVDRAPKLHKNVAALGAPIIFSSSNSFLVVDRGRASTTTSTTATTAAKR